MPIVSILLTLIIVGVILFLVQTYIPMAAPIKTIITVVVVIFLCIWLLSMFGLMDYAVPMHRVR